MAIKLAFSTVACPQWPLETVARRAEEMGYDGIELRTMGQGGTSLASEPSLSDNGKVRAILNDHGIEPICLSTSFALHHRDATLAHQAIWQIRESLELASRIECPLVRIFGNEVGPGEAQNAVLMRIADRAATLVDRAGELGVQILFENAGSLNMAKQWWWLLNLVEHPMLGLCWNVANAASTGERAVVSVPMLNNRIRLAKVKDMNVGEGSGFVPLGDGSVGIDQFVKQLMGVGYTGYISVEWDRAWLQNLEPPETYLPDARTRLLTIFQDIEDARDPKAAKARKEAAAKAEADKHQRQSESAAGDGAK